MPELHTAQWALDEPTLDEHVQHYLENYHVYILTGEENRDSFIQEREIWDKMFEDIHLAGIGDAPFKLKDLGPLLTRRAIDVAFDSLVNNDRVRAIADARNLDWDVLRYGGYL